MDCTIYSDRFYQSGLVTVDLLGWILAIWIYRDKYVAFYSVQKYPFYEVKLHCKVVKNVRYTRPNCSLKSYDG